MGDRPANIARLTITANKHKKMTLFTDGETNP